MTFNIIKSDLAHINFFESGEYFPHWRKEGIPHGFTGVSSTPGDVYHAMQVHGSDIILADQNTVWSQPNRLEADGLYIDQVHVKVGVKTADCVPVLLHCQDHAMAVHAGWKGLAGGIVSKALKMSDLPTLKMGIGPCISAHSFEIGEEVLVNLLDRSLGWTSNQVSSLVSKGCKDRWHFDLGLACAYTALNLGLKPEQVSLMRTCTMLNPEYWHSFRRDREESGRNWSWIARKG